MARRKFRTDALFRDLLTRSLLREGTSLDKQSRSRASACWVKALPMADQFDRTTSRAANFSSARSTIGISGRLRLGIAALVPQWCGRVELESDACRQMICSLIRGLVPQPSHR